MLPIISPHTQEENHKMNRWRPHWPPRFSLLNQRVTANGYRRCGIYRITEYHAAIKNDEIVSFTTTWIDIGC